MQKIKRRTNEEFLCLLGKLHPNIKPKEPYQTAHTKILFECLIDGYEWETEPNALLKGYGCPRCSGKERYTPDSFVKKMLIVNPNIEFLSPYKATDTPIRCRCKLDGYEWSARPHHLLNTGSGCPKCSNVMHKTLNDVRGELRKINPDIEISGNYINNKTKLSCLCLLDGHVWLASSNQLLRGEGCPVCKSSKGERRVRNYLTTHRYQFEEQHVFPDCKYKSVLLFDFYIPEISCAIEYDGEQHFTPVKFGGNNDNMAEIRFEETRLRDKLKDEYCKSHHIKLIRIPYTEYDRIEEILDVQLA